MMKKNADILLEKPKPFIAPDSQIPVTSQEIERRKRRLERLKEIGERPTRVTEEEFVNPYKLEAIALISEDKEVPKELIKKIEEFENTHFLNNSVNKK